jgi:iron complex outermembrane recepter protein
MIRSNLALACAGCARLCRAPRRVRPLARILGATLVLLCADNELASAQPAPEPEVPPPPPAAAPAEPEAPPPASPEAPAESVEPAAPPAAADTSERPDDASVGEIVVTARRRAESAQRAPVAVTAFDAEALQARNVDSIDDVQQFTPNVQLEGAAALSGGSSNVTMFIRGIGLNDFAIFSDPGVGLYVDEVYLGRSIGGVLDVLDLERTEVVRGPQGTLFGRNTIGGALLLSSHRPVFEDSASVRYTLGRFGRSDLTAVANASLIDQKLAVRVAVANLDRGGYARRLVDNEPLGDINRSAGRVQLLWKPVPELEVTVRADATRAREHSAASTLVYVRPGGPFIDRFNMFVAPNAGVTSPSSTLDDSFITGDPYTTYATGPNRNNLDSQGVSLTPVLKLGSVTLKSISALRRLEASFGRDGDNTPFTFRETSNDVAQWQFSQELQAFGDGLNERLQWMVGLYYFQERAREDAAANLAVGLYDALEAADPGNPMNVGADLQVDLYNKVNNKSAAAFANASLELFGGLSLAAGLRLTYEDKGFSLRHTRVASNVPIVPAGTRLSADWTSLDPRVGLQYKPTDNILAYATWSRGFKSGGFNGRPLVGLAEVTKYNPERLWSYELGIKTDWLDRKLRVNATAFYYDYRDIQLTVLLTPQNFVGNAARSALYGGELEVVARPVQPLRFNATLGYLENRYRSIGQGLGPGQVLPINEDSRLPKAPRWTLTAGAEYMLSLPAAFGSLSLRADYGFRTRVFNDVANTPQIAQGAFGLLSANITWRSLDERWEIVVFGTNLTDERYRVSGNASSPAFGIAELSYARPREWGVTLAHRF